MKTNFGLRLREDFLDMITAQSIKEAEKSNHRLEENTYMKSYI